MNYQETIDYLYQQLPMFQRVGNVAFKKDLTNVRHLLAAMDNPHRRFPTVHVAGTNGKGSSAHGLAAILQAAGYRTGLYTSPHLKSFTERIRLNGEEVTEAAVVDFVQRYRAAIEEINPSFFEVTVAMAFHYFAQQKVDIAVVEVGMGGRLDATNVITPAVSLITNIGYDHTEWLGDTLAKIAGEKAGIIKSRVPVVIGQRQPQTTEVFTQVAQAQDAPLAFAEDQYRVTAVKEGPSGLQVNVEVPTGEPSALTLSLRGWYQRYNLPGVLATVAQLRQQGWEIPPSAVRRGLANVQQLTGLKGRWQVLQQRPLCLADTAHNVAAWHEVVQQLASYHAPRYHFVLGVVAGKDLDGLLALLPQDGIYYFCQPLVPRALPVEDLAQQAQRHGLRGEVIASVQGAYERARQQAQPDDVVLVSGSTFVVAELNDI